MAMTRLTEEELAELRELRASSPDWYSGSQKNAALYLASYKQIPALLSELTALRAEVRERDERETSKDVLIDQLKLDICERDERWISLRESINDPRIQTGIRGPVELIAGWDVAIGWVLAEMQRLEARGK